MTISTWRVNCGRRRKKSTRLSRLQISGEESGLAARMAVPKSRAPSPGAARSIQEPHVTTARGHHQVDQVNGARTMPAVGTGTAKGMAALGADAIVSAATGMMAGSAAEVVGKAADFGLGIFESFIIDN